MGNTELDLKTKNLNTLEDQSHTWIPINKYRDWMLIKYTFILFFIGIICYIGILLAISENGKTKRNNNMRRKR